MARCSRQPQVCPEQPTVACEILREIAQQVNLDGMTQRTQRLDLNLANALASQPEVNAQLFQGMTMTIMEAITQLDHRPQSGECAREST